MSQIVEKPWGAEEIWAHTDRYVGKILFIKQGESLSFQYHVAKDETILVFSGRMKLEYQNPGEEFRCYQTLYPGDVFHIAPNVRHRMTAVDDVKIIEVSTPELDDVIRLEDDYGRA